MDYAPFSLEERVQGCSNYWREQVKDCYETCLKNNRSPSIGHLESNLADFEKGPLPADVVETLDEAWLSVKGVSPPYGK